MIRSICLVLVVWCNLSVAEIKTFSWVAPTKNEDGTPITDLAGFRLHCNGQSGLYNTVDDIEDFKAISFSKNFGAGTHYCALKAYTLKTESIFSNEVSFTVAQVSLLAPLVGIVTSRPLTPTLKLIAEYTDLVFDGVNPVLDAGTTLAQTS